MAGTSLINSLGSSPFIREVDQNGLALTANCTGTPPTTAGVFQHGCLITQTDSGTSTNAVYQNIGSSAVPSWSLVDTASGALAATSLVDANGATAVGVTTVATAVNYLNETSGAAGQDVTLAAVGADTNIYLKLKGKGSSGVSIGSDAAADTILVGHSSAAQSIQIGTGAAGNTVLIDNANTVGADIVNIGTGLSSGAGSKTVNIATGPSTVGINTVNIGTGATTVTGGNTIHIGDGTPTGSGTDLVTIGSVAGASATTIQSGTGGFAIRPSTTGVLTVGNAAGTGNMHLGLSSGAQTVDIGHGSGAPTINIADVSTAGATIAIAGAATATGNTDSVAILNGSSVGTGIKTLSILTGTPGSTNNNRMVVGDTGKNTSCTFYANLTQAGITNGTNTETGSNNAIAAGLNDANSNPIPFGPGLFITVILSHSLQAGANTFNYNGTGAVAIKSHYNPANNIGIAYVSGGVIQMLYNGTVWLDLSQ